MKRHKSFFKRIMRKSWGFDLCSEARYSFRDITLCFDWGVSKDKDFSEYTMYLHLGFLFFNLDIWGSYYRMPK
jgi:hypothetical protein